VNDRRRIIRALEVYHRTGKPISAAQQHQVRSENERPRAVIWLEPPRAWLRDRIDRRVDQMMEAGWLEEARRLMLLTPPLGRTARQALGYRGLFGHLQGVMTLEAAVEQTKIATRQFAKRQHTWFRNLQECQPLPITGTESAEEIAATILRLVVCSN
jgi:tRNA dimethylallyltransferase